MHLRLPCVAVVDVAQQTLSSRDPSLYWRAAQGLVIHFEQSLLEVEVEQHPITEGFCHSRRSMGFFPALDKSYETHVELRTYIMDEKSVV